MDQDKIEQLVNQLKTEQQVALQQKATVERQLKYVQQTIYRIEGGLEALSRLSNDDRELESEIPMQIRYGYNRNIDIKEDD
jgi:hypothetical protein